jgi:cytochrome P450 family 4
MLLALFNPKIFTGQKFAMLEMKEVLSTVLRHFELRAVYPERDEKPVPDLILRPKHGIHLKLLPRI